MGRGLLFSMIFALCVFCVPSVGDAVTLEFVNVDPIWTNVAGTPDFDTTTIALPGAALVTLDWIFDDPNYLTETSTLLFEGGIPGSVFDVGVESNLAGYNYNSAPHAIGDLTVTSADLEVYATVSDGVNTTVGDILVGTIHFGFEDGVAGTDMIDILGITSSFSVGGVQYEMVNPKWTDIVSGVASSDTSLSTELSGSDAVALADIHATIIAVVPEPETYALLGSCLVIAGLARRLRERCS